MNRHPIKHQLDIGVLHFGLLRDSQLFPAVFLALTAMGLFALGSNLVVGMILALTAISPVCVMILDNLSGGMLRQRCQAWLDFRRSTGVYDPGAPDDAVGYALLDPGDDAQREAGARLTDIYE